MFCLLVNPVNVGSQHEKSAIFEYVAINAILPLDVTNLQPA